METPTPLLRHVPYAYPVMPFLSALIRDRVMHSNTSVNSVNEHFIFHCIISMQIEYSSNFMKALTSTAAMPSSGLLNAKFMFKGTCPNNHCCTDRQARECLTTFSSSEVKFYTENRSFAFLRPHRGLGAMYEVHLRLTGKHIGDFLLVLIELFC